LTAILWGLSICHRTGLGSAHTYPALDRLMKAGLVTAEWEDPPPADRPRRHLYRPVLDRDWYRRNWLLLHTPPTDGEAHVPER